MSDASPPAYRVRRLTAADAPAYVAIRREMLDDSPWSFLASPSDDLGLDLEHMTKSLGDWSGPTAVVGAFDAQDRLVGVTGLAKQKHAKAAHRALVWGVYVTPSARRARVGEMILRATMDVARTWPGVAILGLCVSENAPVARRLYERLGFRAWGHEPDAVRLADGRSFGETHMWRPLD